METDNHSTVSDFEYDNETGMYVQKQQQQQRQFHRNYLAANGQQLDEFIWSAKHSSNLAGQLSKIHEKMDSLSAENGQLRTEIENVKMDNKLSVEKNNTLLAKVDALQAHNSEQKALIGELRAKLQVVELKAKPDIKVIVKEMIEQLLEEKQSKFMEANQQKIDEKLKLMTLQICEGMFFSNWDVLKKDLLDVMRENERKFNELEGYMSGQNMKMELLKKEVKELLEQGMASLGGKVGNLESQTADAQDKRKGMQKGMEELNKKLEPVHLKQPYLESVWPNYWDKWTEDIITGAGLFATKSGGKHTYGNVMAKFPSSTFYYFEVMVKQRKGTIHIGVCDADFTELNGSNFVGGVPGSCGISSNGYYYNYTAETQLFLSGSFINGSFNTNDIIGCGILPFSEIGKNVFFATKNGTLIGIPIDLPINAGKKLFPSISMTGQGTCVEANFGADLAKKPFSYNIAEHRF